MGATINESYSEYLKSENIYERWAEIGEFLEILWVGKSWQQKQLNSNSNTEY